jgi:hypothetical protein
VAYRFDLERDFVATLHADAAGTITIEFALGYDIERDTVVVMSVMLVRTDSYLAGRYTGIYDLQFGIRQRDLRTNAVTSPDFGTESTSRFIPKASRAEVAEVLLRAIWALVDRTRPNHLTMETYYSHLPDKALEKYERIAILLNRAGFEVRDRFRDEASGIDYWYLTKADLET